MSNIEEIAKSVQSNGIFKKENWLSLSDEKKARKIILSIKPKVMIVIKIDSFIFMLQLIIILKKFKMDHSANQLVKKNRLKSSQPINCLRR